MKKIILLISLFILNLSFSQNLILNGDFEDGPIPTQQGQLNYASYWSHSCSSLSLLNNSVAADLFDRISTNNQIGVPANLRGNLDERNGNNRYVYIAQLQAGFPNTYNSEIIKGSLCSPLTIGNYNLSFWVARPILLVPGDLNYDFQILEVYLVNNTNCNGKLIYTSPNINQTTWQQLNTNFSLNATDESIQYNKILIKFKQISSLYTQTIFLDGFDLRKQCDPIDFDLPSTITTCGQEIELCAPNPPLCENYTYTWSNQVGQNTNNQCFYPSQPGNYTLNVTNDTGCSYTHNFTVTNNISPVELGHDINLCEGDHFPIINIDNQGFNDTNSLITWYHNGVIIQNGGTVLNYIPNSGTISVTVTMPGCQGTTVDQIEVSIKDCCPEVVNIGMILCKGEEPIFHVLNQGFDDPNIEITWMFDNQVIQNGGEILSVPVYGNGELTVFIEKPGCPKITDTIIISCNNDGKPFACFEMLNPVSQYTKNSFYGSMIINEYCKNDKIFIDGNCSLNENGYHIRIAEFNLSDWTFGPDLYNDWVSASGTAPSNISLNSLIGSNFISGKIYLVSISVGPVWTSSLPQFFTLVDCHTNKNSSINDIKTEKSFNLEIYPNPTNDNINFVFEKNESGKAEIYSLEGKLVFSKNFNELNQFEANLSEYQNGVYIVRINIGDEVITKKIIKE